MWRLLFGGESAANGWKCGGGGEYTVRIDAADPEVPVVSSSTHPDAGVDTLEIKMFKLNVYACTCS